jgi:hypothetical protein
MKLEAILGCVMGRAEQRERNNDIEVSCTAPVMGGIYMVRSLFHLTCARLEIVTSVEPALFCGAAACTHADTRPVRSAT